MTTMVVGGFTPAPAVAAPGDGVCYLIADSGGANGGNDLLTIVDRGDFDPATNETNIGTGTGTFSIEAMDMNPATLELYAANANRLGRIDKLTGVFTPLPNTFGNADGALGTIAITDVDGLAFDYITGELWGAERQTTNDLLVKIDITTGLIVQDAFGPGVDYVETDISLFGHDDLDDIAFHPFTGVLYGSITGGGGPGRLVTLDTATGNATDIGPFGAGDMEGMRFDAEGFLWATSGTTPGELFEINITTGAATNPRTVDNGGDYESTVCYVPGSDLWLDKTVSESVPIEGGTTTYTIEVFNAGPANATGVVVEDVLPTGVTFVAAAGPGTYDETTGVWNAGAIDRNESAFLSITVSIDPGTAGTTITNTATRTAVDQGDAVPNNDTDSVDITPVIGTVGLGLDKTSSAGGLVEPGQTITYTLDITNAGTTLLDGISVVDAVPAGTTFVAGSTNVTGYQGADYRDEFNSESYATNNGSASFSTNWTEFGEGTDPTGGDIRIITDTGTSPDQAPYQLRLKDDGRGVLRSADLSAAGYATVSLDFRRQDLDSSGDFVVLEVAASATGTYRELARFAGPGTDATYMSSGPHALQASELTSTATFRLRTSNDLGNGDIVWVDNFTVDVADPVTAAGNAPDTLVASGDGYVLPPGATMQVEFDVIADSILSQSSIDNTATVAASGAVPASDSASDVVATADVSIEKTVDNPAPNPGDTINYTITVTNNGPSAARLIEVTDVLPSGVTYVSDDSGGDYNDTTGVWAAGNLPSGGSTSIVITATVDAGTAGTTITNTATITQTDRPDPNPTNDSDDADIDVPVVDLAVNKTVDNATPVVGDTVVFTITITNNGPDTATGVSLDDTLPGGVTYVSDTTSAGSYSSGVWTVGTMASGATETLTLTGTVDAGTYGSTITNTASVASVTETDSDPGNDSDTASVNVLHNPAIQVVKDGPAVANIGDTVTYTFTVTHTPASDGSPVTIDSVTDDVAGAAGFVSGDTNGNSLLDGGETWTYAATHVVTAGDPDPILNTVTVTGTDEDGDDLPDSTDDHTTDIEHLPVIVVAKTGPAVAAVGDTVTYTFTVSHDVTSDGTPVSNLTVNDDVAGAATYTSGDDGDGLLEAGETWTFTATYTIQATDPDPLVNTGTATGDDEDGDPVTDDDTHTTDVIDPAIQIEKTPDSQTVVTGTAATFSITVTNTGDADLTDVEVTDAFAPACDNVIGDLAASASTTFTCSLANVTADFTNTASVVGTHAAGGTVSDSDTADVTVIDPAIQIEKTPDSQTVVTGTAATFSITVTNTGDADLTDVEVTDAFAPACDNVIGDLAVSASTTYACSLANVTADFTNTASVVGSHAAGGTVSDSDTADVTVIDPAISITKSPNTQTILTGTDANFTITVVNTGDTTLTNVLVTDVLAPACGGPVVDLTPGESASYPCSLANVTADFTNTASVVGSHAAGGTVSDDDTADVAVIDPAIEITKSPDNQQVLFGDAAAFTIVVTNTGDADLTNVEVTDPLAAACDNVIGNLAAGASTTYTCSLANVTADFTNTASVIGTHAAAGTVIDSDTADVDVIGPAITIDKTPDTQQVRPGDTVTFDIRVENTGDVALTDVTVTDAVAPNCDAAFASMAPGAVQTYSCTMTAGASDFTNTASVAGDGPLGNPVVDSDDAEVDVINPAIDIQKTPDLQQTRFGDTVAFDIRVENTGDVVLTDVTVTDALAPDCDATFASMAPGAVQTYSCTMTAGASDFTNTANVTGDDPNGDPVIDSDDAAVDVINPAIDIQKTPDLQQARSGDPVTFTITVTNTGDVDLTDVTVSDAMAPACDNTIGALGVGVSTSFDCTMTALADDFTNTADVTGDDPNGVPVNDSDDAAVDVINPAIDIQKTPNTQQARSGDTVTFDIRVENTGDVTLTDVIVSDTVAPSCDATFATMAPGAVQTYSCTMTALADDFTNTADVTGDDPNGDPVSDSDGADVDVINPSILIEKSPDTQFALSGGTVTFDITVTNNGDVDLAAVTVTDIVAPACDNVIGDLAVGDSASYQCTMAALADDFTNVAAVTGDDPNGDPVNDSDDADVDVINPSITIDKTPDYQQVLANGTATFTITVTNNGDADLTNVSVSDPLAPACDNVIGDLAVDESASYSCSLANVANDFTNTASVVGTHAADGTVTDSDTADVDVIGPAIDIQKTPDSQQAREGDTVTFTIRVENTGDVTLTDVTVSDTVAPNCDATFASMAPGAVETYTCTMTAGDADFTNTADVTGNDPLNNPVTDTDSANVDVIVPSISITKDPATQLAHDGDTVTFTITVANTGDVDLTGVTVTDATAPACDNVIGDLAVSGSVSYDCSMTAGATDFTNTADVTGNDPLGAPVTDNDSANVDIINPSILIEKGPDSQQAIAGGAVTFDITVTNNGDVDLSNVAVTDAAAPACDNVIGSLAAGTSTTYSCTIAAGGSDFTNTASVTGDDPLGTPVTDSDTADVDVVNPAIDIAKNPASQTLLGGETATFNITVTNIGDVPLTNVVVTDPQAPDCDATFPSLAVAGSETYSCTLTNVSADFTNVAVVAGEHPASPDPITDSDVADVEVIAPEIDIQKTPDTQTVVTGSDVTFTITVENVGDVALTNVVVTDALAPVCDTTIAALAVDEVQSYDCTVTGVTAGFTNTADVTAQEPSGGSVSDTDDAVVTVIDPSISIDKSPDSQTILPNGDATFSITVTNTGDVALSNVVVSDPQAPSCDATFATLTAGASESYNCTLSNVAAGFTNVATVTAEDPLGSPVEDSDTADVVIEAPSVEIIKTADTPTVVSGGDAIFTITVTNTGTTPLTGVTVTDPIAPSCAAAIGDLAISGTTTYSCTVAGVTADFTNTASVVGAHPLGGTVSDDDSADVDVIAPAISITKDPATQQVLAGQDATFTITVTNNGDVDLTGVAVTDALAPVCDNTIGALAVDEVVSYTCAVTAVADFTNTAAVSGLDPLGNPVSDSDDAIVDVIAPAIQIEKTPDLQYAVAGSDVTFTITVTNTGDVDLTGVAVTDALAPVCDATIGDLAADASSSYDCTVTGVTADFTNNAAVSGLDPLGNPVSDDDDAVVDVIDPSISLTKDPAAQQILSGQDANFTITVTNNGDSPLTNVTITDAQAPACDAVIAALGVGASATVTCSAPTVTSSFTNTASVVGTHAAGGTVSDSDTADVEVLVPEVDIQKTPDLQVAGVGDTVTFDITVTNAGVVPLTNVTVTDAIAPNCDATIGDLAVGADSTYSCTLTVSADLTNTAVVNATDAAGNPATDSDTADVDVVAPAITIEKTPDNQSVVLNDTPTFTITVTNTGDVDLSNVVITDALAPACDATFANLAIGANETYTCDGTATAADFTNTADVAAESVVGPVSDSDTADVNVLVPAIDIQKTPDNQLVGPAGTATFTITVTNAGATPLTNVTVSDPLAPNCDATFASLPVGGVETYTCDVSGVSGDFTNTASVTGDDPLGNPVEDSDTADVDFVDPAITIAKTPDLQTLLAGEDASFTITVTNTGDTDLTNIVITDPLATGCEATFATLAIGASETVTCDVTAVAADFTNVASVTADTPLGTQVSDSDDALVDVVAPGVQIEKTPDTQQIHSGDDVTFTITVTNNGDQDLVDLTVTDALTPSCDTTIAALAIGESTSYDCTATGVTADFTNIAAVDGTDALGNPVSDSDDAAVDVINPAIDIQKTPDNQAVVVNGTATFDITVTNTGDVDLTGVTVSDPAAPACDNAIGDLAAGGSVTYSCSLAGVAGDFTNTASVTGNDPLDAPVTDRDTADVTVLVPSIDIQKTPDLQQARAGDTVDFTITVSNAGATPLTNVTVTDAMAPACDTVIGDLAVGGSTIFTCSMTAGAADFTNTADVTGDDPIGNPVTDSDTADVDIIGPSINIEKSPDGQTVVTGGTATFTIEVTNTGDVDLSGVTVSDAAVPACDATIGDLAVGESSSYTCSVSDVTADFTNTAVTTGTDPIGAAVTDSDTADVTVLVPGIDIQKTPDTQTVVEGDEATFTIIVTNTGQTDLSNVTVSDPLAPACDNVIGDLPVGSAPVTYTCTAAAAASFTNTAAVDATDPLGNPLTDSDTADVVALVRSNISGTVAHDVAGDGLIDGSDSGLGGVDVTATWAGLDGVFGTADDEVFTTVTDGNGDYSFDLVPPGEYQIDVDTTDLPAGVDFQTLDPDATLDSSTALTLPQNTTVADVDFAYTATGSIGDLVWLDLNNDGVQDPGEPGLGGIDVTVTWLGPDGVPGGGDDLVFTTSTAPDGSYLVDGLPAGEFTVVIGGIPAGLNGDLDQTVTLGAAEARDDVDFPLVGSGSIGDQVFEDLDHDGVFDSGEPGVPGVTVTVTWAGADGVIGTADDVVFTTVTDGNGEYGFDLLPAGEYLVEVDETTIPADLGTAPPVTVNLGAGETDLTADFPLVGNRPPVAVDDEDVTDEDTPVVITVLDDDSDPDGHSFVISTTTDPANGSIVVNPDGTITYTPNPGFVGVDTFTYTICELDGVVNGIPATGLCDTATVTVTIVEVNDPPGPEASFQTVVVGSPVGPMPVFDPDGGPVTVTYISGELPPGITMNPDGTFNGVTEEIGIYQVVVEVCDDDTPQMCITHTHTIAVTPVTLPGPGDDPDPDDPPDTLPFTGANFGELLMAALAMLMAGGALVLFSRKRRYES